MASQAGQLESSLRRSAKLGLEVLERACRRSVDWSSVSPSSATPSDGNTRSEKECQDDSSHTHLDDAFETIAEFMAQTTYQCKNFYLSETEPRLNERDHVCRYHAKSPQHSETSPLQDRKHARSSPEDFHIEVSPGTYVITAGSEDSQQQSRLVHIKAGESRNLTFHL
ncbi:hypothetical protein DPEC_G00219710 [Dallia pectoralis]|uniref:Uncharacterized protein n=1 Tax=Dallia pectoralis TaxID=75939 RepID=A0ACC2G3P7_DALPE|nr:hypothetical protein DPEC_G00219710 [Dallia pectoralis]